MASFRTQFIAMTLTIVSTQPSLLSSTLTSTLKIFQSTFLIVTTWRWLWTILRSKKNSYSGSILLYNLYWLRRCSLSVLDCSLFIIKGSIAKTKKSKIRLLLWCATKTSNCLSNWGTPKKRLLSLYHSCFPKLLNWWSKTDSRITCLWSLDRKMSGLVESSSIDLCLRSALDWTWMI